METRELDKLKKRFEDKKVTHFSVFKGENWGDATPEERAKAINDSLDRVESGDFVEVKNLDDTFLMKMPTVSLEDWKAENFAYRKWKFLSKIHSLSSKFETFMQWKIHKIQRFINVDYNRKS